jgi:hypothetical protein
MNRQIRQSVAPTIRVDPTFNSSRAATLRGRHGFMGRASAVSNSNHEMP